MMYQQFVTTGTEFEILNIENRTRKSTNLQLQIGDRINLSDTYCLSTGLQ